MQRRPSKNKNKDSSGMQRHGSKEKHNYSKHNNQCSDNGQGHKVTATLRVNEGQVATRNDLIIGSLSGDHTAPDSEVHLIRSSVSDVQGPERNVPMKR